MSHGPDEAAVLLDARGERCPLPVIRLGRLARELGAGALVRLLATDPAAASDVPAFCRMRGHDLVSTSPWVEGVEGVDAAPDAAGAPADAGGPRATAYVVRVSATAPAAGPRAPRPAAPGSATEAPR